MTKEKPSNKPPDDSTNNSFWNQLSTTTLIRFLLFLALGWALIQLINYFEYVIFVFAIAATLALLLNYPVRYLERFLGRGFALGIVIVVSLITIIFLTVIIGLTITDQLSQLVDTIIQTLNSTNNPLDNLQNFLARRRININLELVEEQFKNTVASVLSIAVGSLPSLLSNYVTFIIILVVAFFMVSDGEKLWQFILKLIPAHYRRRFSRAVKKNFLGFLRGQFLIAFILSISTFVVFIFFKIPFALALSITIGVFDLIPGIGATLGVTLVTLIILVQSGWFTALIVLVACILLQQIQDNFIAPRVMQSAVQLNPVVVFFALLVGTRIAGFLGIFLAVPIAGIIVSLLEIEEMQSE